MPEPQPRYANHAPPPLPKPEEPAEIPQKYRVVGRHTVCGIEPGGFIELTSTQAASLVEAGHIKLASNRHRDSSSRDNQKG